MNKLMDCVLSHENGKYYFFNGINFSQYTDGGTEGTDPSYPKAISEDWPSGNPASGYKKLGTVMTEEGWDHFDTVLPKADYEAYYFFHGDQYVKYEKSKGVSSEYPKSVNDGWDNMWNAMPGPYDAAYYSTDSEKYYFFKGSKYMRYTPKEGIDNSYPRSISQHWKGLGTYFPGPYSGAAQSASKKDVVYFFKGEEYVRFKEGVGVDNSIGDGEWAYPMSTEYMWPGVWSLKKISALTLGMFKTYMDAGIPKIGPTFSTRQLVDEPISMKPIEGVALVELTKIKNDNYKGVTKWFQLQGLAPNTTATIELTIADETVETFTVKNGPAPGTSSDFSFAMGSCMYDSRQTQSTIPTVDQMKNDAPDFMIWNGDTSYYVGPDKTKTGKTDVLKGDMKNQNNMFLRMYTTRHHPSIANAMRNIPAMSSWDDHDFGFNNAHGAGSGSYKLTATQLDQVTEVFRTCWPTDFTKPNITDSIEYTAQYGNAAFYFPDGRTYRDPGANAILGSSQCATLLDSMRTGPYKDALLKVVVLGSQLISTVSDEETFYSNAPDERSALLNAFCNGSISGRILVLTGDVHFSELSCYGGTASKPKVIEVTSSPLLLRDPTGQKFPDPKSNNYRVWSAKGNTYAHVDITYNGNDPIVNIQLKDAAGATSNIYRSGGGSGENWEYATAKWDKEGNLSQS